jgi:hypothetical protein
MKNKILPGMTLIGPHIIGSNSLSVLTMASIGSLKTQRGSAKLQVKFLYAPAFLPTKNLMISKPTAPTTIAVVVAIAGIIFPAISLTLKLSTSSI